MGALHTKAKRFPIPLPALGRTPPTTTTAAPNLVEVTNCFTAVADRIRSAFKMESLYSLLIRVYKRRVHPFHLNLSNMLETSGDYAANSGTEGTI